MGEMPEFTFRVDLGHILTIGVLLVSIGIGWGNLASIKDRVNDNVNATQALSLSVNTLNIKSTQMEERLRNVEKQLDRQYDQSIQSAKSAAQPARP